MMNRFACRLCAGVLAAFALCAAPIAHGQDRPKKKDFESEGRELFKKKGAQGGESGKETSGSGTWAVAVFTFRGDERASQSRTVLQKIHSDGLPEARMEERGESVVILVGSFEDPLSPEAKRELARVRAIKVGENQPYASAFLAPPSVAVGEGRRPEINLLRLKEQEPGAVYSLQVAVYGRRDLLQPSEDDLKDARKSAEQAALQLRSEGEQAYYYHGPRMSMVTIGVFDLTDYDPQLPQFESDRLKQARKRHPLNLYNGKAIKISAPGKPEQIQTSELVRIPKK